MKLSLAPLNIEEIDFIYELYNNSEIFNTAILGYNYPQNFHILKRKLDSWLSNSKQKHFLIKSEEHNIGLAQIFDIHLVNRSCKVGLILEPNFWGQGYGNETIKLLEDICFKHLGLQRIEAEVLDYNHSMVKVLENRNFLNEGTKKKAVFKNGKFVDLLIFGKLY